MNINTKYNVKEHVYILDDNNKLKPGVIKGINFQNETVEYTIEVNFAGTKGTFIRSEDKVYLAQSEEKDTEHGD